LISSSGEKESTTSYMSKTKIETDKKKRQSVTRRQAAKLETAQCLAVYVIVARQVRGLEANKTREGTW
jgi:hypothetical protein